jgi:para-aminobenzoate synthetase component 1
VNISVKNSKVTEMPMVDPVDFFQDYSDYYYSTILTGRGPDDISEYTYIYLFPHTILRYSEDRFEAETESGYEKIDEDFWEYLHTVYRMLDYDRLGYPSSVCGAVGYFSYDGYHTIEKIKPDTLHSYNIPLFELVVYNRVIFLDHQKGKAFRIDFEYKEESLIRKKIPVTEGIEVGEIEKECSREEYIEKVKRIKEYIVEGDVYEVCLTQQFSAGFEGDPYRLFENIYGNNPAPFSAFMNFRDAAFISNSPELFIRCSGKRVETRPIKGTAPRFSDPGEDRKSREKLLASEKDQAELFMIIDLLRNDIGKVCRTGSVKVIDSKRIEPYENVFQLIGIVEGELEGDKNFIHLLKAVFPGGSITGCPKVRSMEIIEELETYRRNLYTGTIFHFNRKIFTSSIVIRTAVISGGRIIINSGGAVTIDSDPDLEYEETVHKIRNILKALGFKNPLNV